MLEFKNKPRGFIRTLETIALPEVGVDLAYRDQFGNTLCEPVPQLMMRDGDYTMTTLLDRVNAIKLGLKLIEYARPPANVQRVIDELKR